MSAPNRIYRLIWSDRLGAYVVAAENVKGRGKRAVRAGVALAVLLAGAPAQAAPPNPPATTQLPTGGQVAAGSAAIVQSGATMDINQASHRAVINWNTFNVGAQAQVNFNQPSASSATLNRVLDTNPSQILGRVIANGQVFFVNPNGVYFGRGSSVDVGALVASAKNIKDADFMAGNLKFTRDGSTGSVVNEGEIRAALSGFVALLAPEVRNEGVIVAQLGTVALASGEAVSLRFDGDGRLHDVTVEPSQIKALVENKGAVLAPGGLIVLSARAVDRLQGGVVKNSGTLEATGMTMRGGRIVLDASDRIENTGTVNANAGADGSPAGSIALAAPEIVNSGLLTASGHAATASNIPVPAAVAGGTVTLDAASRVEQSAGGRIDVSGSSGGSARLAAAQDILIAGAIDASAVAGIGGSIDIAAARNIGLNGAVLDASGAGAGGRIHGAAGNGAAARLPTDPPPPEDRRPTLALTGTTQLRTGSARGRGGDVTLTGERVGLLDATAIDAAGATGGGSVRVGGDWQGGVGLADPLPQAVTVVLAQGARIDASATRTGAGGTVVLWSDIGNPDSFTRADGTVLARGGAAGGDGGRVETSGHRLDTGSTLFVDTRAAAGKFGQWLLDPYNYTIASSGGNMTGAQLSTALSSANVQILTTASTSAGYAGTSNATGNIYINDSVTIPSSRTLTLTAAGIISGTGNIANNGTLTIEPGDTGFTNIFSGVISGSGSLIKNGGGYTQLQGPNTYTGSTTINAGTVFVDDTASLGSTGTGTTVNSGAALAISAGSSTAEPITLNGGTLRSGGASGSSTGSGAITLTADSYINAGAVSLAASGVISGAYSLEKTGTGTVILSGANTYTGTTIISAGTLQLGAVNRIADASAVTVASGAIFDLNNYSETVGSIAGAGNITLGSGTLTAGGDNTSTTFSGIISETGALTKTGSGTLTLSGANTYSGATTISAGTLKASNSAALGTSAGGLTIGSSGTFDIYNVTIASEAISLQGGTITSSYDNSYSGASGTHTGTVTMTAHSTVDSASGGWLYLTGTLSGAYNLTKTGSGNVTLSGSNTYSGTTTVNAGTLFAASSGAFGTTGTGTTVNSGGTLAIAENITSAEAITLNGGTLRYGGADNGTATASGAITLTADSTLRADDTRTLIVSGVISGAYGIAKGNGTGTVVLSGANTYTGATTVSTGTLQLGAANRIADGSAVTVASGATFDLNGYNETVGSIAGAGNIALGSGTLTAGGDNSSTTFSGVIGGTGALTKSGSGTLTLSGANTYSGATTISAGTLKAANSAALGSSAGGLTIGGSGTLDIYNVNIGSEAISLQGGTITTSYDGGYASSTGTHTGTVTMTANSTVDAASNGWLYLSGIVSGAYNLTKTGSGYVSLAGSNTYSGTTAVNAGALFAAHNNALGTTGNATTVGSGATLSIANGITSAEPITLAGGTLNIGGTDGLSATASGAITLTASSTLQAYGTRTLTVSGVIGGSGYGITKDGTGTVILSGANTYTGATTVSAGTLAVTVNNALGTNAAGTTVASGATLDLQNVTYGTTEGLTLNGGTLKTSTGTSSFAGAIGLGAASTINVDGTQLTHGGTFSANGYQTTFSGSGTTLFSTSSNDFGTVVLSSAGSVSLRDTNTIAFGASSLSGNLTVVASGAITQAGAVAVTGTTSLTAGSNDITLANSSNDFTGAVAVVSGANVSLKDSNSLSLGAVTMSGDLSAEALGGNLTLSGNIGKSSGADATATLKASGAVIQNAATSISSSSNKLHVVIHADSDANSDGYVSIGSASITTNGGNLTIGGGADPASGYAKGNATQLAGVAISGATLNAGGGNIAIRGSGKATGGDGIQSGANATISTSGTGAITLDGVGYGGYTGIRTYGSGDTKTTFTTVNGGLSLTGLANGSYYGIDAAHSIFQASNGDIGITGSTVGGTYGASTYNTTVTIGGSGNFTQEASTQRLNVGNVSVGTGNITLISDVLVESSTGSPVISGSGTLTVKPKTAGTSIGFAGGAGSLQLSAANFAKFSDGFSGITIGSATAGTLTIGGATTLNDATAFVSGGNIVINAALNGSGQTITLTGGNGGTVSGSGNITATGLLLNGSGATYTLNTATGNSVGTLAAATGAGNVAFFNSAALTIGTVGATAGITNSGTIDVETLAGDLTIAQSVVTTSTSATAVVLNAGRTTAALTATGGNLLVSGSPSVSTGSGGIAKLYSGGVSGSTGLTALIGSGSGRFRYSSDETTTNFTTAPTGGVYAIYRESFAITAQPANYTTIYGAAVAPTAYSVSGGALQNGDTLGAVSATISSTGTATSNAGTYDLSVTGMPAYDGKGYALTGVNNVGGHTIAPAALTITANSATRTYDGTPYSGGAGVVYAGFVNGEGTGQLGGTLAYVGTAQNAIQAGSYTIVPSGLTVGGNYTITYVAGTLTINQAPPQPPPVVIPPPALPPVVAPLPENPPAPPPAPAGGPSSAGGGTAPTTLEPAPTTTSVPAPFPAATPPELPSPPASPSASPLPSSAPLPAAPAPAALPAGSPAPASPSAPASPPAPASAVAPESVRSISQSISGTVSNPETSLNTLAQAQVSRAIAQGLPAELAGSANKTFSQVLTQQLGNGVPPAEAMAAAERAIQAEAGFPSPNSPREAAAKSLASTGLDVGRQLDSLANAKTASGSEAFDKSLAVALAKGASFDDAVKTAQQAVQTADGMTKADASPLAVLAGIGAGGGGAADGGPLAKTAPGFQKTLGSLLAKGLAPAEAMQRAQQAEADAAAAARADATPAAALARGDFAALADKPLQGSFGKVLSVAMAKGIPVAEALARAAEIDAFERRAAAAEARSPLAGFSGGTAVPPQGDAAFERALASAIARGAAPADALAGAQRSAAAAPRETPTASTALASGRNIETLLNSPGNSHVFKVALGNALAKGVPVDKALAGARRAEDRNAFRFPLPAPAAKIAAARSGVGITALDGGPLPPWLHYVPEAKSFVAFNVPEGGLPLKVLVTAAGRRSVVTVSERADRK